MAVLLKLLTWCLARPKLLLWLTGGLIVMVMLLWVRHQAVESYRLQELVKSQQETIDAEKRSHSIGIDLTNGTNRYEAETRKIPTIGGAVIDDAARMRLKARTDASQRARSSIGGV